MKYIVYAMLLLLLSFVTSCQTEVKIEESNGSSSKIYRISEDCLNGWTDGIITENRVYLLSYCDSTSMTYVLYMNNENFAEEDGILFYLDDEFNLSTVVTQKGVCTVNKKDPSLKETFLNLFMYDGTIKEYEVDNLNRSITRVGLLQVLETGAKHIETLLNLKDCADITKALMQNHVKEAFGIAATNILTGIMTGSAKMNVVVTLGEMFLEHKYKQYVENLPAKYLSDASIYIEDVSKISDTEYKIKISTYNFSDVNISEGDGLLSIHAGLAIKKNNANVSYTNCDYILGEHCVNADDSFTVQLYVEPNCSYYIVPFLIVNVNGIFCQFPLVVEESLLSFEYKVSPLVSYGNREKISVFNGVIDSFKQTKAEYTSGSYLYFEAQVKAHIFEENTNEWGVYIQQDGKYHTFPYLGNDEISIFQEVNAGDIINKDYTTYVAKFNTLIGVYYSNDGWFSSLEYGEAYNESFVYDQKPLIKITNLSVGSTVSINEGDWDRMTSYSYELEVSGALFMDEIYSYYIGNWTTLGKQDSFSPLDGKMSREAWVKYSSGAKPHTDYKYIGAMVDSREIKSTNQFVYNFNGSSCRISLSDTRSVANCSTSENPMPCPVGLVKGSVAMTR